MIGRVLAGAAIAGLLLGGCAGSRGAERPDATALRREAIARAEANRPGKLLEVTERRLVLSPYRGEAAVSFRLGKDVPVFIGGEPVPWTALRHGTDVNVFYVDEDRATAIQVLEPGFARALGATGD